MITKRVVAAAGAAALGLSLAGAPAALAQTAEPAPLPAPEAQAPSANFSDDTLRSFAVAFLAVDRINREYVPRVESAPSSEEQQQLREEASRAMVEAVDSAEGISPQEYTQIITEAQSNPEFAAQLNTYIGEAAQQ